ncbi:hypothetical protein F503_07625 [Ophiostoma piceae UAMH 11346]|uniref:Uncharacterized protein n=1 Tax=Ophiostoma piceae (strain UAMH 11346) TaxID=1262450 RepID=S3BSC0_OPHP1|nr:hypothetical protein F503_07625 [Ophiostoma piceae UAMH 11346]
MSSSIPIPPQASGSGSLGHHHDRKPRHHHHLRSMDASMGSPTTSTEMSPSPSTSSSSSSSSSSTASPSSLYSAATPPSRSAKGKEPVLPLSQLSQSGPDATPTRKQQQMHRRRPSLLSSAILHQEAQVINIGDPDGAPRLISYLSSSQGFIWNPEIFVPSYVDYDYTPLENRREPIVEIFLSDEEVQQMFPE